MAIADLLRQIGVRGRAKDAAYVQKTFQEFTQKVLNINGHAVIGQVAGLGGSSLTYEQVFDALRISITSVRATYAEEAESARIEQILQEALKG